VATRLATHGVPTADLFFPSELAQCKLEKFKFYYMILKKLYIYISWQLPELELINIILRGVEISGFISPNRLSGQTTSLLSRTSTHSVIVNQFKLSRFENCMWLKNNRTREEAMEVVVSHKVSLTYRNKRWLKVILNNCFWKNIKSSHCPMPQIPVFCFRDVTTPSSSGLFSESF
jgi:hypothetical protein